MKKIEFEKILKKCETVEDYKRIIGKHTHWLISLGSRQLDTVIKLKNEKENLWRKKELKKSEC